MCDETRRETSIDETSREVNEHPMTSDDAGEDSIEHIADGTIADMNVDKGVDKAADTVSDTADKTDSTASSNHDDHKPSRSWWHHAHAVNDARNHEDTDDDQDHIVHIIARIGFTILITSAVIAMFLPIERWARDASCLGDDCPDSTGPFTATLIEKPDKYYSTQDSSMVDSASGVTPTPSWTIVDDDSIIVQVSTLKTCIPVMTVSSATLNDASNSERTTMMLTASYADGTPFEDETTDNDADSDANNGKNTEHDGCTVTKDEYSDADMTWRQWLVTVNHDWVRKNSDGGQTVTMQHGMSIHVVDDITADPIELIEYKKYGYKTP